MIVKMRERERGCGLILCVCGPSLAESQPTVKTAHLGGHLDPVCFQDASLPVVGSMTFASQSGRCLMHALHCIAILFLTTYLCSVINNLTWRHKTLYVAMECYKLEVSDCGSHDISYRYKFLLPR